MILARGGCTHCTLSQTHSGFVDLKARFKLNGTGFAFLLPEVVKRGAGRGQREKASENWVISGEERVGH